MARVQSEHLRWELASDSEVPPWSLRQNVATCSPCVRPVMIMTRCSGCEGGGDCPQPSTPLPCFIDLTIKPDGQMAPKLHGGALLPVLALMQFTFCSRGHGGCVRTILPWSRWSSSAEPAGYCSRHRHGHVRVEKKNLTGSPKVKKFNLDISNVWSQSVACQKSSESVSGSKTCFTFDGDVQSGMLNLMYHPSFFFFFFF